MGSPPRMRGKASHSPGRSPGTGITPAYAGKRHFRDFRRLSPGDHPRVCGEKPCHLCRVGNAVGSPPRMRGKAPVIDGFPRPAGITPAYAGKSHILVAVDAGRRDHPRVCGEKPKGRGNFLKIVGSPPRMRGKVRQLSDDGRFVGITPAYAGKRG